MTKFVSTTAGIAIRLDHVVLAKPAPNDVRTMSITTHYGDRHDVWTFDWDLANAPEMIKANPGFGAVLSFRADGSAISEAVIAWAKSEHHEGYDAVTVSGRHIGGYITMPDNSVFLYDDSYQRFENIKAAFENWREWLESHPEALAADGKGASR